MKNILLLAKQASQIVKNASSEIRTKALYGIASQLENFESKIMEANQLDIQAAISSGLSKPMIDRLTLTKERFDDVVASVRMIAAQPDPVGDIISGSTLPNNLHIVKQRVPLGVVGIVYESRPNVTVDCACLCIRSGNVCILRGGKEAINTNQIFATIISDTLVLNGLPSSAVSLIDDPDRSKLDILIKADKYVDLIVPRGGFSLIQYVTQNAYVPVIKHDKGVCSIYVDAYADKIKAIEIIKNSKTSRPSACNAIETVIINEVLVPDFLHTLKNNLPDVRLYGCEYTRKYLDIAPVIDWGTEYLDYELNVKVVSTIQDAICHISEFGSGHSDAIITENYSRSEYFLDHVDSACVYVNASTRFSDGGVFGLGAEVGISTQKLHARGPMGAYDLTTYKYRIYGNGQVR